MKNKSLTLLKNCESRKLHVMGDLERKDRLNKSTFVIVGMSAITLEKRHCSHKVKVDLLIFYVLLDVDLN